MIYPSITAAQPLFARRGSSTFANRLSARVHSSLPEDLAYRVFFVTPRTISRDLKAVRKAHPNVLIPMRSTLRDIGPVLTHRVQIIKLALQGKTTSQICQIMHHSPEAVANYLSAFTRCAQLAAQQNGRLPDRLSTSPRVIAGPGLS